MTARSFFNILNNFGIKAWTSDPIKDTVLALLMNRDTMISVLYVT